MSTISIQPGQPEASSSTPSIVPKHLATFVFDSSLPRSRYKKLTVADGVVHKLVQRLMEKHGGETNLRLCLLITASASDNRKSRVFRKAYTGPLAFLTSLPNFMDYFPKSGRQPSKTPRWPSFSDGTSEESGNPEGMRDKKRKRKDEITLLNGVVGGVETLNKPYVNIQHSPSRTFISLTPSSATPLLDSLHAPLSTGDETPGSPARRYLVVVASDDTSSDNINDQQVEVILPHDNWDSTWDGQGWQELARGIKGKDIRCSCVVVGQSGDGEMPSKKLKSMCKEISNGSSEAPWFSIPPEVDLTLAGYSIESGSTPPLDMASTVATEPIETPISNPQLRIPMPAIPTVNADGKTLQQLQNQAMQARMAQFAKAVSSVSMANGANVKVDPQMMASMLQAMKNPGNTPIDMTDPKWQQVRQLLQLQQQRQMAASSNNNTMMNINQPTSSAMPLPVPNAVNTGMNGNGNSQDQNVMAAIQQQRAQQAQNFVQNQNQSSQQQQQPIVQNIQAQQQQQSQSQQQQVRPAQQQIWSGSLSSASQPGNYTHLLNLDASKFSGNSEGILAQHWPKDLQLRNVVVLEVQTLTAYAQAKNCPIVVFTPSITMGQDSTANSYKYTQLANSLHAKGNMVIIPFGTQDRGIVLFSASMPVQPPTPSGSRQYHLMGVVCLHVPFPPLNAATIRTTPSQAPQQPLQPQVQAEQQIPQPRQPVPQQQQQQPQQQQQQQQQQYRPPPSGQNAQNNNNNNAMYHQQMLLQAQSAMQNQSQPQTQTQSQGQGINQQQQQQQFVAQQQQQFIPQQSQQQQQQQQQEKRGISQQQYTQLMLHAQRLGLNIQQFDYNNMTSNQMQAIINGIKMAEAKLQQQRAQAQAQAQQQQQLHQQQQQQQQQMVQLQQMLASQGQFTGAGMGDGQGYS